MTYFYNFQHDCFNQLISGAFLQTFAEAPQLLLKNAMILTSFDFHQDSAIVSNMAAEKRKAPAVFPSELALKTLPVVD